MLKSSLLLLLAVVGLLHIGGSSAHLDLNKLLLKQQKELDLSAAEVDALRPLYREFQAQHDYLYNQQLQNGDASAQPQPQQKAIDTQLDAGYLQAFDDFRAQFDLYVNQKPTIKYDISLPKLEELIGHPSGEMTEQQLLELQDMQAILLDVLEEAEHGMNQLVKRAIELEINFLSFNKPKFVMAALGALGTIYTVWGRGARAAYCGYSHVPQFAEAINSVNGGVECYKFTMGLILQIQDETVASVKEIKHNIQGLIKVYNKISAKKTLFGKILSGTLNVLTAVRRVHDIIAVGLDGYDKINNQLPTAAAHSAQCGLNFVNSIPQMIQAAQNVTTCIAFVDRDKPDYEFTKPEEDRYWNTGVEPPEIPHDNDNDDDDDDKDRADNGDDDYVDHR